MSTTTLWLRNGVSHGDTIVLTSDVCTRVGATVRVPIMSPLAVVNEDSPIEFVMPDVAEYVIIAAVAVDDEERIAFAEFSRIN